MRLIDADALADAIVSVYGADGLTEDASLIYGLLLNRPTINAEPVVRCKDCRHANECRKIVQYARNEQNTISMGYLPIEWCSRGERREP